MSAPARQSAAWNQTTSDSMTYTATISSVVSGDLLFFGMCHNFTASRKVAAADVTDNHGSSWLLVTDGVTGGEVQNSETGRWTHLFQKVASASGTHNISAVISGGLTSGSCATFTCRVSGQAATSYIQKVVVNGETSDAMPHTAAPGSTSFGTDVYALWITMGNAYANAWAAGGSFADDIPQFDPVSNGSYMDKAADYSAVGALTTTGPYTSDLARHGNSVMVSINGAGGAPSVPPFRSRSLASRRVW